MCAVKLIFKCKYIPRIGATVINSRHNYELYVYSRIPCRVSIHMITWFCLIAQGNFTREAEAAKNKFEKDATEKLRSVKEVLPRLSRHAILSIQIHSGRSDL
jgi:hypothetical protein